MLSGGITGGTTLIIIRTGSILGGTGITATLSITTITGMAGIPGITAGSTGTTGGTGLHGGLFKRLGQNKSLLSQVSKALKLAEFRGNSVWSLVTCL